MPVPAEVPPERHELLAKIASLYYEVGLTQSEIAKRFGISRSGVSRLLAEARETGVVNISVRWPNSVPDDLSTQLARHYPDTEVRVVGRGGRGYSQIIEALGAVAAGVLEEKLQDHNILGISWNTGVYQVVGAFRAARKLDVTVVQLTGSTGLSNPMIDGPDLARWLASVLGGQYLFIPAPLIVDTKATRNALLSDRTIAERLFVAQHADVALVGIGSVFPPLCTLHQLGYLSETRLAEIAKMGAVGEMLSYFYNLEGDILPLPLHERTIGLPLEKLRDVKVSIGVAAGREQGPAVVGAIRGGYVNSVVIDDEAAEVVLALTERGGDRGRSS